VTENEVFKLRKKYFKLFNNFEKCVRRDLLTERENATMSTEVKKAKKEWEEAEEIFNGRKR
jgi:hypothetical protein